jgi:hypothetical protein
MIFPTPFKCVNRGVLIIYYGRKKEIGGGISPPPILAAGLGFKNPLT